MDFKRRCVGGLNFKTFETKLVCPKCNCGFVVIKEEEKEMAFPSSSRERIVLPIKKLPTCTNCCANFQITIDECLKISFIEM